MTNSGIEKRKVSIDLLKHLATLSLGAIALIASFYSALSGLAEKGPLLSITVVSFFACILASVLSSLILLANIEDITKISGTVIHSVLRIAVFIAISSFVSGAGILAYMVVDHAT